MNCSAKLLHRAASEFARPCPPVLLSPTQGLLAIQEGLKAWKNLTHLSLAHSTIDTGSPMDSFLGSFSDKLEQLDLSYVKDNNTRNEGPGRATVVGLAKLHRLVVLDMRHHSTANNTTCLACVCGMCVSLALHFAFFFSDVRCRPCAQTWARRRRARWRSRCSQTCLLCASSA